MMTAELTSALAKLGLPASQDLLDSWVSKNDITMEEIDDVMDLVSKLQSVKDENSYERHLKSSGIPTVAYHTFDSFRLDGCSADAKKTLGSLRTLYFISSGRNVLITGKTGTGKTHLAMAIGDEACRQGLKTCFTTFSNLNRALVDARNSTDGKKLDRLVKKLTNASCLVIDDIGGAALGEAGSSLLSGIIENRRTLHGGCNSIIMTSSRKPSEWNSLFSPQEMAYSIIDRLMDRVDRFELDGPSFRGRDRIMHKLLIGAGTSLQVNTQK